MAKLSEGEILKREWVESWIKPSIAAYYELHPKPSKPKRPDLTASTIKCGKIYMRNAQGTLIAIYGATGRFLKITPEKMKTYSIKIKPPKVVQSKGLKTKQI